jgi:hypothetical protein
MDTYQYIFNLIKANNRDSLLTCIKLVQKNTFLEEFQQISQEQKENILVLFFNKFAYSYISHYENHFSFLNNVKNISENTAAQLFNFWLNNYQKNKYEKTLDFLLSLDIKIHPEWTQNMNLYNQDELLIQYDNVEPVSGFFKIYAKQPDLPYHHYHNMAELIMAVSNFYKNNANTFFLLQSTCHTEWAKKNNNPAINQPPKIEKIRYFALDEQSINYFNDLEHKKGYSQKICNLFEQTHDLFYKKKMCSVIHLALKDNDTNQFIHFLMEHVNPLLMKETLKKHSKLKNDEKIYLYLEKNNLEQIIVDKKDKKIVTNKQKI